MSTTIDDTTIAERPNARPRTARTRQTDLSGTPGAGESRIYRGGSVEELIGKIQADLGSDAIILRRRSGLTGGVGGFFQRQFVEIEACASHPHVDLYDEPYVTSTPPAAKMPATMSAEHPPGAVPWPGTPVAPAEAEAQAPTLDPEPAAEPMQRRSLTVAQQRAYAELYGQPARPEPAAAEPAFARPMAGAESFERVPVAEPERLQPRGIDGLIDLSGPGVEGWPQTSVRPGAPDAQRAPITMRGGESFAAALAEAEAAVPGEPVEEQLLAVGVGEALVKDLIDTAATVALPLMSPEASLRDAVRLVVQLMIPMGRRLPSKNVAVALVGPGGSGKSMVCRELLMKGSSSGGAKVACATITPDIRSEGYLVALEPHFSTPMPIADSDVQSILRASRKEGLLLLDTPAVSPADRRSVFSLASLLDTLSADLIMMTMPATLGAKPAAQMLRAMRALGASALAITHADETDQLGVAVQAACAFGLAPEYLMTSRTGDERLIPIDPTSLVERLLPLP